MVVLKNENEIALFFSRRITNYEDVTCLATIIIIIIKGRDANQEKETNCGGDHHYHCVVVLLGVQRSTLTLLSVFSQQLELLF